MKKLTTIMVAIAIVFSVLTVAPKNVSAKVTVIPEKNMKITIGKRDSIYVKQKNAKFRSSNKKVVTVSKKGVLKAKKTGKAKITVKVGKSKKKVTVTVIPANVKTCTAVATGTNGSKVTWSKAKGAKGYYVYYATSANGKFAKKATKSTSLSFSNLTPGATYYYKVKAYGNSKTVSSKYSSVSSVKIWKLVWSDEFNGDKLDTSKWNNNGAAGRGGYGSDEKVDYEIDYCEVKNGSLVIKPQFDWDATNKKAIDDAYYVDGKPYSRSIFSPKLWTRHQFTVKYGRIDFVAKMPKGRGTWAAGWMLGEGKKWPECGEIDVFETTSDITKTLIPQTIHCNRFNGMPSSSGPKHFDKKIPTATTAYHTYTVEWTPTELTFLIDGKVNGVYDPSEYVTDGNGTDNDDIWPYKRDFYLIVNCAIGGTLGGNITPENWARKINTRQDGSRTIETYQDDLSFDAVRVYK